MNNISIRKLLIRALCCWGKRKHALKNMHLDRAVAFFYRPNLKVSSLSLSLFQAQGPFYPEIQDEQFAIERTHLAVFTF